MPRSWENVFALGGLVLGFAIAVGLAWRHYPEGAFWSVAGGFSALYGFGCFRVWYGEHATDEDRAKRHPIWFLHMYWLNALGSFVGWVALWVLASRVTSGTSLGLTDFVLFLGAFLGLVGWLPFGVIGLAIAVRNLAEKALDLTIPKG